MITLTNNTTDVEIELDPDLLWTNQYQWSPILQAEEYSLTGALILQQGERTAGRPIDLEPPDDGAAWMPLSMLKTLSDWAKIPGLELTLDVRGEIMTVVFRHQDQPAVSGRPVVDFSDPADSDFFLITLRFQEI